MINLLPPEEKKEILFKLKEKIIFILWILAFFFILSFILILLSINFYIKKQIEYRDFALQEIKKDLKISEFRTLEEKISPLNSELLKLDDFYQKQINFSRVIDKISSILPQGIYLKNLSFISSDNKGEVFLKVTLSGFSATRDLLFEFKNNLEKENNFQEIYFPPANWVKSNDIDFNVTFNAINK